ncbi:dihydropteroate synthase [Streptomonospora nanhaiensis]|uniref:dihydropteroate synthase n=1 Tax=Streptomonospora nanhaiensis TaxID=1323731 RepID=UPI001C99A629|nr:dihydropteroate synthase [Streptomonospora nanhaiensis]MBX9391246.1 dihydropteroate synthase [Streptomonospora nanhaiensis]
MGVVNVTPDSFSDGGSWFDTGKAVEHGLHLADQGADIVDVGGESTRPGAQRVSLEEELRRIEPVVRELARQGVAVSVDTMRAEVADRAVAAGARLVNDVSGGLADPAMARLVASTGVAYVLMHWRGHSHRMEDRAVYADVVQEVHDELRDRMAALVDAGVDPAQIVLDPGLGFSKRPEQAHNWALLAHLDRFADLGRPVLVAGSRKRFLGRLLSDAEDRPRDFTACDDATVALTTLAADRGAWCVRVHDVRPNADAVRVAAAWRSGGADLDAGRGELVGRGGL